MLREVLTREAIRRMPADEAAAWFAVRRAEGLGDGDAALLAAWLAEDPGHPPALAAADRAWDVFDEAADDEILAAMRSHALASRRAALPAWAPLAAAAAAVFVLLAGAALLHARVSGSRAPGQGPMVMASAGTPYVSAIGQVREIALADGSRMTLDADSAAIARIGPAGRSVTLTRGRALFDVVHDPGRPFTVVAGDRRLTDIGTRFDVNLGPGALTVTLLDGALKVGGPDPAAPATVLRPGQQLVRQGGREEIRQIGPAAEDAAAWRSGLIRFDDQPLADAAAVMNRYSREPIVIADPGVAAIRVTGQFHAGQSQAFAETLAELYHLHAHREGGHIALRRAG